MISRITYFFFALFYAVLLITAGFPVIPADAGITAAIQISGSLPFASYNVSVSGIDTGNATITWNTNGNANSTVEYGTTTGYGSLSTDTTMTRSHAIRLYGLSSGTTYHYRVLSITPDGASATSTDATFKTLSPNGTTIATATQSTSFTGTTVQTTGGVQSVQLNVSSTAGTTEVSGNTVTVQNPGNGWSRLQYTGSNVTSDGGNVSIEGIQSVTLESDPVLAELGGNIGTVSTQIELGLKELVSDISIQQNIIQGATANVENAFQLAAAGSNLSVEAVAYTVQFTNTAALNANLNAAGVTLNLSVDHAWVIANAPDGNVNNIRILRFGDDGKKEVLTTRYLGSQGSTDFFEATSINGLSVFGVAAVAPGSGNGGGTGEGNTGGGGSGDTSGSTDSGGGGGVSISPFTGLQPEQVPARPAEQPVQQPGPVEGAATTTRSLTVPGLTLDQEGPGVQTFRLDTAMAEQSGATITVTGSEILISEPGFTLTIVATEPPTRENGILSGTVKRAEIQTEPAYADLGFGRVSVALDASLDTLADNAAITTAISDTVAPEIQDLFRTLVQNNNQELEATAYIAGIGKTNLAATGPAGLTFTLPSDWVSDHGGTRAIVVARISDQGSVSLLRTDYLGTDAYGTMSFRAISPDGLSVFGFLAVQPASAGLRPSAGSNISAPSSELPFGAILWNALTHNGELTGTTVLLVASIVIIILAAGLGIAVYTLRSPRKKNRNHQKKR